MLAICGYDPVSDARHHAGAVPAIHRHSEQFPNVTMIPSIDKGRYACQRVFPALFALFALAGVSPPASQKPKFTCKYISGRCFAVLPEQKCAQARKDPQGSVVFSRGLTRYGDISARQNRACPCQSMVKETHSKRSRSQNSSGLRLSIKW